MPRIAINGFGRIGRNTFKAGFGQKGFEVVAINDLTDPEILASLLQNDTVYGRFEKKVKAGAGSITVGGKKIPVFSERDPSKLPWKELKIDLVIESTGVFRTEEAASAHIKAGAKRVIISAPSKGGDVPTYILGVNDKDLKKEKRAIVDNASCTTNCAAPVMSVLEEAFGVKKAMLSTIHAYTATQKLQDGPHKDPRRARAAAMNVIPTTTGSATSTAKAIPSLKGKFDGMAFRVPVINGSVTDFTVVLKRKVTVEEVNKAFVKASKTPRFKGKLITSTEPLVSSDIIGNPASSIVDLPLTMVVAGDLVKVVSWYDNEWGYSVRLAEMALKIPRLK
ncbi:type I glyceraldehyde-3-phosphate dehydrogenase [Candidatus Uhrbacteria bacterium]|jgi:glyceraldehyde 3-phosphate dehydrogenase|nr:type I glyceraldehyde-3-phosphate dehydrogenase [Candidatus Uhrbacteria bacterium]